MKAAVMKGPGIIEVMEVPTPKPGKGDVLLKVEACALCGTDQRVLSGEKHVDVSIVGHEVVGTIEEVGADVNGVKAGERYAAQTTIGCGKCAMCKMSRENLCEEGYKAIGYQFNGGFAEYMIMPAAGVAQGCLIPVPVSMPADEGTLIEPLSCCVNGMSYIPFEGIDHVIVLGSGIIGVMNGLVARARGAKRVTVMDVSQERLDLLKRIGLPFSDFINTGKTDPVAWVKEQTGGCGVGAVIVAASVKKLVVLGLSLLGRTGHLSIFAGMPKSDPTELLDLNVVHYRELNIHGANSSSRDSYLVAKDLLVSGKVNGKFLVTHRFSLDEFKKAVATQADPSTGALKVVIIP